ncbi:MAG TPA: DHHA1 domain-containing protein, partial [Longimicrobiales bacterium]|nr:DHHA1 domain-containing protein [Longimicrobiales bacterium]
IAGWLRDIGKHVHITNPTPFPEQYKYTVEDWMILDHTHEATANYLSTADLVFVLDTGEPKRIGRHADAAVKRPMIVLDHHPIAESPFRPLAQLLDTTACSTGELVYDLLILAGYDRWEQRVCEAIYTAIITDTGSFRFSNTTPRAHAIAGEMIRGGVDPEVMYRRLYGTVPMRRITLLRAALETLEADENLPLTWITITRDAMKDADASSEDLEGLVDYARSIEGTEIAILFRETNDGATKISFRSTGDADVNALARQFGGGGHVKAAGALISDKLEDARPRVLEATRIALRQTLK